jgi:uncharacterized protein (DUF58 family)
MLSYELFRTVRRIEIRTRHLVDESFAGEYHSIFRGRGIEFDNVRKYQPGDDVRTIDWNVTARTGFPYVKQYVEERELTVMLAFDASSSARFGTILRSKREMGAELGAVLALSAVHNNDKVGLLVFTHQKELYIPPRKGRRHVLRLIRDLLIFRPRGRRTDLAVGLEWLNRVLKRRAIIFLFSDFLADPQEYERTLNLTNRRHDLVACRLTDPRELTWPDVGLVGLEDIETGALIHIDTGDGRWRNAFAKQANARRQALNAVFARARIDCIDAIVGQDYVAPLSAFFEKRARRLARQK